VDFNIPRWVFPKANDESFDLAFSKRYDDTASGLDVRRQPVHKRADQWQANSHIGVHEVTIAAGKVQRESVSYLPRLRVSSQEISKDTQDETSR